MPLVFRKVAIVTKANNELALQAGKDIANYFENLHVKTLLIHNIVQNTKEIKLDELKDVEVDLVFAIGGDGTILRAVRNIKSDIPVYSLNVGGNRGILADTSNKPIYDQLSEIIAGNFFYDRRMRITAEVNKKFVTCPALNDIVITRTNLTKTPIITLLISGDEVSQKMDGVILSTPTGSTGHSLSMGGPIIHESMDSIMVMPIAPVDRMPTIIFQPMKVIVISTDDSKIIIDGQEVYNARAGESIKIERHISDALFLRLGIRGIKQLGKVGF
jgi:NAD+ kinase